MQAEERKYSLDEITPYINWVYFDHAWQMSGAANAASATQGSLRQEEYETLHRDALDMLHELTAHYFTHALFMLVEANGDGDDIVLHMDGHTERLPMLRQQHVPDGQPCLCMADFVRPLSSGVHDCIGIFAATVDEGIERYRHDDPYQALLAQTLADRLAEATAERLHEQIRKHDWGYAPDEALSVRQLHREEFQGIRPAVGYPSLPDVSLNFELCRLLDFGRIGILLTESGMMQPHGSVSGLMIAHPQARYFNIGKIGQDQLDDYARRRHVDSKTIRKYIQQ
ncbi:MAG: 5-methyltetrahydrofolate--homocysteine methyltransferase [Prevotella sp.]|nr:5-methyltetrahydrofolate--homocysteine methyltransferase [Prevotella sp.]